jgi:hypothetical protein
MYRGLLKTVARVWNPKDIQDQAIQEKVLAHLQAVRTRVTSCEGCTRQGWAGGLCCCSGVFQIKLT